MEGSLRPELDAERLAGLLRFLDGGPPGLSGYEAARTRLVDFFRWRGVSDPETYADRTFDRVARRLAEGERPTTAEPLRYVLGVARFIYLEGTKAETRARETLERELPLRRADGDEDLEAPLQDLRVCLDGFHPNERRVLLAYHQGEGGARIRQRRALADELGIDLNALRIRVHRWRKRLETCLEDRQKDEMDPPGTPL